MKLTLEQAAIVSRFGRTHGSRTRMRIREEANVMLRNEAERLMAEAEKAATPPVIVDIQVYQDAWLKDRVWVKYVYSDGDVKKLGMIAPEAGAIKTAWEAGINRGRSEAADPRDEDET